jgi:hypothetical protein
MQPGGGDDIKELLRQHGKEAIYSLADSAGLRVGKRLRCPFRGCSDQPPERAPNLGVFAAESGVYKVKCHRCGEGGDLLDLIQAVRGVGPSEALAQLRSGASPTPRPALRVVPAPRGEDPDKLPPAEWKRLWEALAREDAHGRAYLESRGLEESPLVRFVTEAAGDSRLKKFAKHGRRVAMLMTDVVGNPRGMQARLAREAQAKESKTMFVKGSSPSAGFFGQPELIEAGHVVAVAEGMADTAALQLWAAGESTVVAGAAGMNFLHHVAGELKAAGISRRREGVRALPAERPAPQQVAQGVRPARPAAVGRGRARRAVRHAGGVQGRRRVAQGAARRAVAAARAVEGTESRRLDAGAGAAA